MTPDDEERREIEQYTWRAHQRADQELSTGVVAAICLLLLLLLIGGIVLRAAVARLEGRAADELPAVPRAQWSGAAAERADPSDRGCIADKSSTRCAA